MEEVNLEHNHVHVCRMMRTVGDAGAGGGRRIGRTGGGVKKNRSGDQGLRGVRRANGGKEHRRGGVGRVEEEQESFTEKVDSAL